MKVHVTYSLDPNIVELFNKEVEDQKRSATLEQLMKNYLSKKLKEQNHDKV